MYNLNNVLFVLFLYQDETQRIENEGGMISNCQGIWRVDGQLAVSRAIGNSNIIQFNFKETDVFLIGSVKAILTKFQEKLKCNSYNQLNVCLLLFI